MTPEAFYHYAEQFTKQVYVEAIDQGIDLDLLKIDHLCWRVNTIPLYAEMKAFLHSIGALLVEAPVGGRPIATFKLFKAINFGSQEIEIIECPSPKAGMDYPIGFEHAEVVISESFESFISKHNDLKFDKTRIDQKFNPELILKLPTTTVKFHHSSLERVIELESQVSIVLDFDGANSIT